MKTLSLGRYAATLCFLAVLMTPLAHADNSMLLRASSGNPGDTAVPVVVAFTTDEPIQGYSVALEYDASVVTCVEATELVSRSVNCLPIGETIDILASMLDTLDATRNTVSGF